jgi:two-component system, NtrC family, nitrogen regulation response regulator GlnG
MFQIDRALTLTIAFHPDTSRIGEQCILRHAMQGEPITLNRSTPSFAQRGEMPMPLEDSHVSRSPVVLRLEEEELIIDPTQTSTEVVLSSEWLREETSVPRWKVNRGLTLKLADRIMLCVHFSQPTRENSASRGLIGHGDAIDEIREMVGDLAADDDPALLLGEYGVGKRRVARAIHDASSRGGRAFEVLDLAAIPQEHVKQAVRGDDGAFERAEGGTLYVEGLSDVEDDVQRMFVDLVQKGQMIDVGGNERAIDIRLLVGSGRELEHAVAEGQLRSEFIALFAMSLHIPPLRHRIEDIAPLFLHFLKESLREKGQVVLLQDGGPGRPLWLPPDFVGRLLRHQWPGNGNQLAAVADAVADTCGQGYTVRVTKEVERYLDEAGTYDHGLGLNTPATGHVTPSDISDQDLLGALKAYRWNAVATATHLGISVRAVHDLMDASPMFKTPDRLSEAAILGATRQFGGDITLAAEQLQVSIRGLQRRLWSAE